MLNTLSFQNFFKDLGASYKALAIGIIGGYIGTIIGLPLPWLLGSLGLNLCVAFTKFDIKFPTKLLNPILSRFCNIYIPLPLIEKKYTNLHIYNKFDTTSIMEKKCDYIKKTFKKKIL